MNTHPENRITLTADPDKCPECGSDKTAQFRYCAVKVTRFVSVSKFKCNACECEYGFLPWTGEGELDAQIARWPELPQPVEKTPPPAKKREGFVARLLGLS